jgi:hypothetical protein
MLLERYHQHIGFGTAFKEAIELADGGLVKKVGIRMPRAQAARLQDARIDLAGHGLQAHQIVLHIALVADRVGLAEEVHQLHMQAAELVEDEVVVGVRVAVDLVLQIPAYGGSTGALLHAQALQIHLVQLRQRLLGCSHIARAGRWNWRQLAVQAILLLAAEVLLEGGLLRIVAYLDAGQIVGPWSKLIACAARLTLKLAQRWRSEKNDGAARSVHDLPL